MAISLVKQVGATARHGPQSDASARRARRLECDHGDRTDARLRALGRPLAGSRASRDDGVVELRLFRRRGGGRRDRRVRHPARSRRSARQSLSQAHRRRSARRGRRRRVSRTRRRLGLRPHTAAHRFWLDCFADNARAQSVYEKLGFTRDGVLREAYLAPTAPPRSDDDGADAAAVGGAGRAAEPACPVRRRAVRAGSSAPSTRALASKRRTAGCSVARARTTARRVAQRRDGVSEAARGKQEIRRVSGRFDIEGEQARRAASRARRRRESPSSSPR